MRSTLWWERGTNDARQNNKTKQQDTYTVFEVLHTYPFYLEFKAFVVQISSHVPKASQSMEQHGYNIINYIILTTRKLAAMRIYASVQLGGNKSG